MTAKGTSTTRQDLSTILGVSTKASVLKQSLKRLRTRGLIDCVEGPSEGGSPTNYWFACTEGGMELLSNVSQMQGSISREERSSSSSLNCSEALVSQEDVGATGQERRGYSDSVKTQAPQEISPDLQGRGSKRQKEDVYPPAVEQSVQHEKQGAQLKNQDQLCPPSNPVVPMDLPQGHNLGEPIKEAVISDQLSGINDDNFEDELWAT